MVLLVVAISAVGVYAASEEPLVSADPVASGWDCTGSLAISSPSSTPVIVLWDLNEEGEVTAVRLSWTPSSYGEYTLSADLGHSSGSLHISQAGTSLRTDSIFVNPPVPAASMDLAKISIAQRLNAANDLATSVGWQINASGQVMAAEVMWDPEPGSDYDLLVTLGIDTGSLTVQNPGSGVRTDILPLSPAVPAESAASANLCINEL